MSSPFSLDIKKLRERARATMAEGAMTKGYRAESHHVVAVLNDALATEITCVLRYKQHYFCAKGLTSEAIREEFLEHAKDEQDHADRLALRIVQLNGRPEMDPAGIPARSHTLFVDPEGIVAMIKEDLVAERIVIEIYSEMIRWIGDRDPTTKRLFEHILEQEEEHAEDLLSLVERAG